MRKNLVFCLAFFITSSVFLIGCTASSTNDDSVQKRAVTEFEVTVEVTREVILEKTVLSTVEVTRVVTATPQPTGTQPAEEIVENSTRLSGTYAFTGGNEGQGCRLEVNNTISRVLPENGDFIAEKFISRIYFELDCNRGAPSFNMGSASGVMLESGNAAVYRYESPISTGECNLIFIFSEDKVDVHQIGESYACDFGANVYADGTYARVDG